MLLTKLVQVTISCLLVVPACPQTPSLTPLAHHCSSIENMDLSHARLPVRGTEVQFEGSEAYTTDSHSPTRPDWRHHISQDITLSPSRTFHLRLVKITSDHLTGSGSFDTVLVLLCKDGLLSTALNRDYLYGAHVDSDGSRFTIRFGRWQESDARCCPSETKTETFVWDHAQLRYTLSSTSTKRK